MLDGGGDAYVPYDVSALLEEAGTVANQKNLVRSWLDGGYQSSRAFWNHVRAAGGLAIGDWKLVADPSLVERILKDDKAFDTREYDRRMRATSGRFFLGMDGQEHEQDAETGAIIPSWNRPRSTSTPDAPDAKALDKVQAVAEAACQATIELYGRLGLISREINPQARVRLALAQVLGPVLDACAARFFGIAGPSSISLVSWAGHLTRYHFRPYADEADHALAREASGQYRSHVLAALADPDSLPDEQAQRLKLVMGKLSALLANTGRKAQGSDDDVARNLIGILTGALTATLKAVNDALAIRADLARQSSQPDIWGPAPAECSSRFPLYDRIIAATLADQRRGSLDAVYRKYNGAPVDLGALQLEPNDLVIVWLGGTLDEPDNLFGIGVHKCPGMDMGKAIIEGALRALTKLTGGDAPQIEREEDLLYLVFPSPSAMVQLKSIIQERHA